MRCPCARTLARKRGRAPPTRTRIHLMNEATDSHSPATARVVFMPSGRRGEFPAGTPVLTAARSLGVDIDSVCGGRAICGRCQVTLSTGEFAKLGITSREAHLGDATAAEQKYDRIKGLAEGRRLSCQAVMRGDIVIDVPAESQIHRQMVRKAADEIRNLEIDPVVKLFYVELDPPEHGRPDLRPDQAAGDPRARMGAQRSRRGPELPPAALGRDARRRDIRWRLEGHGRGARRPRPRCGVGRVQGARVRARDRRGHHHHRRTPLQPRDRRSGREQRHDEPADPVRRRPDEPHLLPAAERRTGAGAHRRRAGGDPRARGRGGGGGGDRARGHRRGDPGGQPDHAPPRARHRPHPARDGAVPARGRPRCDGEGARPRDGHQPRRLRVLPAVHCGARGRGHRRGHPLPGPAPRRRDDARDRRRHQRRDRARLREPAHRCVEPHRTRVRGGRRSRTGSARRRARSSGCGSTATP